jgi:hypothetical protein
MLIVERCSSLRLAENLWIEALRSPEESAMVVIRSPRVSESVYLNQNGTDARRMAGFLGKKSRFIKEAKMQLSLRTRSWASLYWS